MPKRILVVEDNTDFSKPLIDCFNKILGIKCDLARDFNSADRLIKESRQNPYILHTIDVELSGHIGLDLIEKYKHILTSDNTAIVTTWGDNYASRIKQLNYPTLDKGEDLDLDIFMRFFCNFPSMKRAGVKWPPLIKNNDDDNT